MSSFEACNLEPFVTDHHPQSGSLQDSAVIQELLMQQVQGYLQRLKDAVCADLENLQAQIDALGPGGVTSFLGLTDTPGSYAGAAGQVATVNGGETALEFTAIAAGGLPDLDDDTEVSSSRDFNGTATFFKLINIGALPNAGTKNVAHNIGASFTVVHAYGVATDPAQPRALPLIFATTGAATNTVTFSIDATNVSVVTGVDRTSYTDTWVVLEYYYN